jgi:hypothetical protein
MLKEIAKILFEVGEISLCVYIVNRVMFWYYRKKEKEYYKEVTEIKKQS